MSYTKFSRFNIVNVPENDDADNAEEDVTDPDVTESEVIGENNRFDDIGPGHSLASIRLFEPCHQESKLESEVRNHGNGQLSSNAPDEIIFWSDEYCWEPGAEVKNNSESNSKIG